MPAAWLSYAGSKMDSFLHMTGTRLLTASDHPLFVSMEGALREDEGSLDGAMTTQDDLLGLRQMLATQYMEQASMDVIDPETGEHRFKHPRTGVVTDHMLMVSNEHYLGFNKTDNPNKVVDDFLRTYPDQEVLRSNIMELVLKTQHKGSNELASSGEDLEDLQGEGRATTTAGVCDCGFRHMYEGAEVDFVIAVDLSPPCFLGWTWGDDVWSTLDAWIARDAKRAQRFGPRERLKLLQRMILKERSSLAAHYVKMCRDRERESARKASLFFCYFYFLGG